MIYLKLSYNDVGINSLNTLYSSPLSRTQPSDMMNNGGAASQWNNAAGWPQQQQLAWAGWQQQGQVGAAGVAPADAWNQGWATAVAQPHQGGWQSGGAGGGGWGQAATNSSSSSSAGQWKSYGSATTGTSGAASGNSSGTPAGQVAGQWNGQQWTGGSY